MGQSEGHERLEGGHYGGVQITVVPREVLHGLELYEVTHKVHRISDVRVACAHVQCVW